MIDPRDAVVEAARAVRFDPADPGHDPKLQLQLLSNGISRAWALLRPNERGDQEMKMPAWVPREWNDRVTLIAQALADLERKEG